MPAHPRKEGSKIVPKRKFNIKTARGKINKRAYDMDVSRKQLAEAAKISVSLANNTLAPAPTKKLHAWMIRAWSPILALTEQEEQDFCRLLQQEKNRECAGSAGK